MTVEGFFAKAKADSAFAAKSRLLIVRNRIEQRELRDLFASRPQQFEWLRLSRCTNAASYIPAADALMSRVRDEIARINAEGKIAYVTGLSAMLLLWDFTERSSAFERMRSILDDPKFSVLFFVNAYVDELRSAFDHPRYVDGRAVLVVGEKTNEDSELEMRLVSIGIAKFLDGHKYSSLIEFLSDYEIGGVPTQNIGITIDAYFEKLPAISGTVKQIVSKGDYMRQFCNYEGGLSSDAEEWLFAKMADAGKITAVKDFAQQHFFKDCMGVVTRVAPRMICGCKGPELEVLIWVLRQTLHRNGYLYHVLKDESLTIENFKSFYVCKALDFFGAVGETELIRERREGIAEILDGDAFALDAEIADFVEKAKSRDAYVVIRWLRNRTRFEKEEVVRRLRQADLRTLPIAEFYAAFPPLKHYLSAYELPTQELSSYFQRYRALKVSGTLDREFCERAKSISYPIAGVNSRDDLLQQTNDGETALVVVDAMGVEYLPMLLSISSERGLHVSRAEPACVKLPTSTDFNPMSWPDELRLPEVKELDNIIHNGAETHACSSSEENFVHMLEVFGEKVFPLISQALAKCKRVVLTADHGASRLAVLAYKNGCFENLPIKGVDGSVEDWRYLKSVPGALVPAGLASNLDGTYWVVKGYDRFSKHGGKLNELHGGLTYEEVLVPFVVFEKGSAFEPVLPVSAEMAQFTENDDFDL